MRYIMGIDGGGTKSHLAIFDETGKCVKFAEFGTLNHECMENSYDDLKILLTRFIIRTLLDAGVKMKDITYSVLGLAGVDTKEQHALISDMVLKIGLRDFTLCNDAYLSIAAGCPSGIGISAINGTGSSMAALDYSGKTFQLGGMGVFTDDCGGGTWFGEQVVSVVYNSLFKCERPTLLRDMMFERLGITDKYDYMETFLAKFNAGEIDICELNHFVFAAVRENDPTAMELLERSARHYAGGIAYLARNMDFPPRKPLQVSLAGSVFVKEKVRILPQLIETRVGELLGPRTVEYFMPNTFPVAGAVNWAAREAKFKLKLDRIKQEIEQ